MNDPSKSLHSHPDSTGNNPPELPSHGGAGGSTTKRKITKPNEKEEEEDVDTTGLSTPTKHHQIESSSAGKDTAATTTAAAAVVATGGRKEEINLLNDIYDFYNLSGRYPFPNMNLMQEFYKHWIEERGIFANKVELDEKMDELHSRFLMTKKKILKSNDQDHEEINLMDDVEIFRLSYKIWGTDDDDDNDRKDDLSENETGDDDSPLKD